MKPNPIPGRVPLKTYSHLIKEKKIPTDYNIATTDLLFTHDKGHSVRTPVVDWEKRFLQDSPVHFEAVPFKDPLETTYSTYVERQNKKEIYLQGLFDSIEQTAYDETLSTEWKQRLRVLLGAQIHLFHGMQMLSAYLGQLAPNSPLIICFAMQTADELRCCERWAYRLAQLSPGHASPQDEALKPGREFWLTDPAIQALRKITEKLLVTYDWAEALMAFQILFKPLADEFFFTHLSLQAQIENDFLLQKILASFKEDADWHRLWTQSYVKNLITTHPENAAVLKKYLSPWKTQILKVFEPLTKSIFTQPTNLPQLQIFLQDWLSSLSLGTDEV